MLELSDTHSNNSVYPQSYGSFDVAEPLSLWFVLLPHRELAHRGFSTLFQAPSAGISLNVVETGHRALEIQVLPLPGKAPTHLPARGSVSFSKLAVFWTRACVCVVVT